MSNCLCIIDNEFNFTISYRDNYFIFTDYSSWGEIKDVNDKVSVTIKQNEITKEIFIYPNQANIVKYDNLIPGECGYDGIYQFIIKTCSDTQILCVNYYILKNIECAYRTLVLKEDWDNAKILQQYIELIKANAYFKDFDKAKEFYSIAVKFIKKLNCNC